MDTTQDINSKDRLGQINRYVPVSENEAGNSTNLKINESFLGFIEVTDETSLSLEAVILNSH